MHHLFHGSVKTLKRLQLSPGSRRTWVVPCSSSERSGGTIVGVDPDPKGALAVFSNGQLEHLVDMPLAGKRNKLRHDVPRLVSEVAGLVERSDEAVHSYLEVATGSRLTPSTSTLQQGIGIGICLGALTAEGAQVTSVSQGDWQGPFGLMSRGRPSGKEDAVALVDSMFSAFRVSDTRDARRRGGRADAVLIGLFGVVNDAISRGLEPPFLPEIARATRETGLLSEEDAALIQGWPHVLFCTTASLREAAREEGLRSEAPRKELVGRLVRAECRREEVSGNDPGNGDRVKRWEALRFLSVLNLKAECQKRGLKVSGSKGDLVGRLMEEEIDPSRWALADLREVAELRGVKKSGRKSDLARRLNGQESQ